MNRKKVSLEQLRAIYEKLEEEKIAASRNAKLLALKQLADIAMKANRERTWNNKQGSADTVKKAELDKRVQEAQGAFRKGYLEMVSKDQRMKRWWGAELQKAYIQGAPEALLIYYLSDNPDKTKPLAYSLKKAADDYIRGWELLGKKSRKELHGPIDIVGNGALAVQILIEQLKAGDDIQKTQAQILEIVFEDPISALGQKNPETTGLGIELGKIIGEKNQENPIIKILKEVNDETTPRQ